METTKLPTPLGDRLLVKLDTPQETTSGGIVLPAAHHQPVNSGECVAVGNDEHDRLVGRIVFFEYIHGLIVTLDEQQYALMSAEAVQGFSEPA